MELPDRSGTLLEGRALRLARAGWVAVVGLVLVLFVAGVPGSHARARVLRPETLAGLDRLGIPAGAPAAYLTVLDVVTMLGFTAIAALIFVRRSDDWIAMLMALTLVLTAMLYTAPVFEASVPPVLIAMLCALGELCQLAVVYLFPSGRFVPRWVWPPLALLVLWRPAMWALVYMPQFLASERTGENYAYVPQDARDIALVLVLFATGFATQAYRYRHVSSPLQRQQTKWLLFGMLGTVAIAGAYIFVSIATVGPSPELGSEALLVRLGGRTVRQLALFLVPVTVTYSILRHRLWDIDKLINRALVYSALTAVLGAGYAAMVVGLQNVLSRVAGGSSLAVAASTLTAAALFRPARRRVQDVVDRRFDRGRVDAVRTIEAFSARLRDEVDLNTISADLLGVVDATMQPTHVSLWLRPVPDQADGRRTAQPGRQAGG
ncbi:MAG TPA: hypothetical protein VEP73_03125 [Actinomycetota bacterium]|nr:hypothetical protein [Actinomycetota bacterium]